jgi:hypothetical protein
MLVCAHDLKPVVCGADKRGYPFKVKKGWVKKWAPIIKIGLFAFRAAVLTASIAGTGLPFFPHHSAGHETVDAKVLSEMLEGYNEREHKLHLLKMMQEKVGEAAEGAENCEALDEALRDAESGNFTRCTSTATLTPWIDASYRALKALLQAKDPTLAHTGLVQVKSPNGTVDWVAQHNVAAWRRRHAGEAAEESGAEGEEEEDETKHGGVPRRVPEARWSTDPACRCGTVFGRRLQDRRHHCRKCGRSVCDKCSPGVAALLGPLGQISQERVCGGAHGGCTGVGGWQE